MSRRLTLTSPDMGILFSRYFLAHALRFVEGYTSHAAVCLFRHALLNFVIGFRVSSG